MEESGGRIENLEQAGRETEKTVKVIYEGWRKLTEANTQSDVRFGDVESRLSSVEFQLQKIAAAIDRIESNTASSKPHGKDVAESSDHQVQEPITETENFPSGYRRGTDMFASRESLLKKIELPTFDGLMPYCWIRNVERYFRAAKYSSQEKLELVALSLTGEVLNWYLWEAEEEKFESWTQFKQRMLERFAESIDDEPRNKLCALRQTGSVRQYVREFEELITQVKGIDEPNLISKFYTGLKQEMKEVIKLKEPKGLRNHIAAVVKMESSTFCQVMGERVKPRQTDHYTPHHKQHRPNNYNQRNLQPLADDKSKQLEPQKNLPPRPRLHLTPAELAELKRLKLCFKCKTSWFRGHVCANAELQILMLVENIEVEVLQDTYNEEEEGEDKNMEDLGFGESRNLRSELLILT